MNPESLDLARKRRRRIVVAHIAVVAVVLAVAVTLMLVPPVRNHLCYEHNMRSLCSGVQIGESQLRIFAGHRDALALRRIRYDIPSDGQRSYGRRFASSKQQRLYWEVRLQSRLAPDRSTRFVTYWTTYGPGSRPVANGVVEATWGADDLAASVTGPVDDAIGAVGQFPPGHYEVILKVYGNQLPESEVRGGFEIY